jgi:putative iron-dependent peroxidase
MSLFHAATGGELFVHVKADKNDLCWEAAHEFVVRLPKTAVKRIDETFAWEYKDSRDLSGFIDGTANPSGAVRVKAALIGAEDPQHQGGSYVLGQTWIHDLEKLKTMQLQAQEHAIGRKKENSAKIGDRPADSHVSRMVRLLKSVSFTVFLHGADKLTLFVSLDVQEVDGVDMKIHRQSLPFGTAQRHGLAFVAYSGTITKIDRMLRRMVGAEGPSDRVMSFSSAVASNWWYVPSREVLAKLAPRSKM